VPIWLAASKPIRLVYTSGRKCNRDPVHALIVYTAPRTASLCRMAKKVMTRVSGYFNSARWPIQIVLSRLNITLILKPGDFILDASGRKINDPYFEVYADHGQLSRELGEVPVPVNGLPAVAARCP
jgi:hypothetical protein